MGLLGSIWNSRGGVPGSTLNVKGESLRRGEGDKIGTNIVSYPERVIASIVSQFGRTDRAFGRTKSKH